MGIQTFIAPRFAFRSKLARQKWKLSLPPLLPHKQIPELRGGNRFYETKLNETSDMFMAQ